MRKNKLSFIALSIASIFYSFHVTANENIIIDDKLKTDLTVEIKDGIEHFHIEKANENGISHNYYQKFNVSKKGAVLENTNDLAAKIIVNEVTSAEKSLLRGKLTVNGKAAELIIANPNGIKCNGCWFAGSPTQRLVIGKVFYIEENSLTGFRNRGFNDVQSGEILLAIENGDIVFKGNSRVHRSGEGRLDLISRNIKILDNSSLSASTIYGTIGDNILRVSHDHQLSIIHYPLSIIHYPLSIIHYPLSIIHYPLSIIHYPLSIIHYPLLERVCHQPRLLLPVYLLEQMHEFKLNI